MQKIKYNVSLGANIRALRRDCGLTQEQTIAKLQLLGCSLTRGSYAKIEAGIQNISVQELLAMKEVFHADFEDFFQKQPEEWYAFFPSFTAAGAFP